MESFKEFSCDREKDLEDFLMIRAISYQKTNYGKTYLFIDAEELKNGHLAVMAYFTIAQKAVDISDMSKNKKRKLSPFLQVSSLSSLYLFYNKKCKPMKIE